MRNRQRYGKDWRQRAKACKERAGYQCSKCGVKQGTKRYSAWTDREWPVYLQAAHPKHDPENVEADLVAVCPYCHWHFYRKPGTRPAWMIERAKHRRLIATVKVVS